MSDQLLNPEINLKFPKIFKNEIKDYSSLLGLKIELQDYIGVIKYVGPLLHKQNSNINDIWVGIEWEDITRGKHNGTVEGYVYFTTIGNVNSGSMIRLNKVNFGQTFTEAVDYKYKFYDTKGYSMHQILDKALEEDNYIQANKKKINIELVGKNKAVKEFSELSRIMCVDLTKCYISSLGKGLNLIFPKIQELMLTKTLLTKWSCVLDLLEEFPLLTMLNFSENILYFDDDFNNKIQPYIKEEKKLYLDILVLNKCKIEFSALIKLCPLFKSVEKLYLMGNELNYETYETSNEKEYINTNKHLLQLNTQKLKYLSIEKNKITHFLFVYSMLLSPNLLYINMNQNKLTDLLIGDNNENELLLKFKSSMKHLLLDYNMFPENKINKVIKDIETLELVDIDVLNNSSFDKMGLEKAKIEIVGRNPQLKTLNNTTITKAMRRDYEKLYLKYSVQEYMELPREVPINESNFNMEEFLKYMNDNHKQYFVLKKRFYDPLDEFVNLVEKKQTNAIKDNVLELMFEYNGKVMKKRFPKSINIRNWRNLFAKLFKIEDDVSFGFYVVYVEDGGKEREEVIKDESVTLLSLNLVNGQKVILK